MIFCDSAFWIALRDKRDAHHPAAREIVREIFARRWPIVISEFILAETHAYFVRSVVLRNTVLKDLLENPVVRMEPVQPADRAAALAMITRQEDKNYSYADAISFAMIARLEIPRAASFDAHFAQPGTFEVVR